MAITQEPRPELAEFDDSSAARVAKAVDDKELLTQEFGVTKSLVERVWPILEADVRREIEAALIRKLVKLTMCVVGGAALVLTIVGALIMGAQLSINPLTSLSLLFIVPSS